MANLLVILSLLAKDDLIDDGIFLDIVLDQKCALYSS